jgi:SAM-dependent methyltransferase
MKQDTRAEVRRHYARAAKGGCCGGADAERSSQLGYSRQELVSIPAEANLGLGCGNPTAIGELKEGETVVDLGSGGGIDCFLAARRVGAEGRVIGVDMTPPMIERARQAADAAGFPNVEFRLGEIEHLPVADRTADVVISNCVINLSPDKRQTFREAYRILKDGGRLAVSDIVLLAELPPRLRESVELYASCVAGAMPKQDYLQAIREAGFKNIEVVSEKHAADLLDPAGLPADCCGGALQLSAEDLRLLARAVVSMQVRADRSPTP